MSEVKQKLKTPLIPESGIELDPKYIMESEVSTDFIRVLAHIIAQGPGNSVALRCSSDGRLLVASSGGAFEIYAVHAGVAAAAYNAGDTFDQVEAQYVTDILVENNPAVVSFRNEAGVYGNDKVVPVGFMSIDLVHYGMRIRNRLAGLATYEFTIYR